LLLRSVCCQTGQKQAHTAQYSTAAELAQAAVGGTYLAVDVDKLHSLRPHPRLQAFRGIVHPQKKSEEQGFADVADLEQQAPQVRGKVHPRPVLKVPQHPPWHGDHPHKFPEM
jgi:hypothetical protein